MNKLLTVIVAFAVDIFAMLVAIGVWWSVDHFAQPMPLVWIVVFFFSVKTTIFIWTTSGDDSDWE